MVFRLFRRHIIFVCKLTLTLFGLGLAACVNNDNSKRVNPPEAAPVATPDETQHKIAPIVDQKNSANPKPVQPRANSRSPNPQSPNTQPKSDRPVPTTPGLQTGSGPVGGAPTKPTVPTLAPSLEPTPGSHSDKMPPQAPPKAPKDSPIASGGGKDRKGKRQPPKNFKYTDFSTVRTDLKEGQEIRTRKGKSILYSGQMKIEDAELSSVGKDFTFKGRVVVSDKERRPSIDEPFEMFGYEEDGKISFSLTKASRHKLANSVQLAAQAFCLSVNDNGELTCSEAFVDFFLKRDGKTLRYQIKTSEDKTTGPVGENPAPEIATPQKPLPSPKTTLGPQGIAFERIEAKDLEQATTQDSHEGMDKEGLGFFVGTNESDVQKLLDSAAVENHAQIKERVEADKRTQEALSVRELQVSEGGRERVSDGSRNGVGENGKDETTTETPPAAQPESEPRVREEKVEPNLLGMDFGPAEDSETETSETEDSPSSPMNIDFGPPPKPKNETIGQNKEDHFTGISFAQITKKPGTSIDAKISFGPLKPINPVAKRPTPATPPPALHPPSADRRTGISFDAFFKQDYFRGDLYQHALSAQPRAWSGQLRPCGQDLICLGRGQVRPRDQAIAHSSTGALRNASSLLQKHESLADKSPFQLPKVRIRSYFGTFELVELLTTMGLKLRSLVPQVKMWVHDLSLQNGRSIGEHRSHRNGTDADIAYTLNDFSGQTHFRNIIAGNQVRGLNTAAQWKWFKYTVSTGWVDRIFVAAPIKREMCKFALRNAQSARDPWTHETLKRLVHRYNSGELVTGHDNHFHLRIACSEFQERCQNMADPPPITCVD